MSSVTATLMTYGADLGEMLAGVAALAALYLSLRRPHGEHAKDRRRSPHR